MINTLKISMDMRDSELAAMWRRANTRQAEAELARMQTDIANAALGRKLTRIRIAQDRLINSLEARAIAIKHVCKLPAYRSVWPTNAERLRAALSLNGNGYTAMPTTLFILKIPGKKDRNIQIPTAIDQAMQILYAFALDPISEVTADRTSFAARRGRSYFDLHAYLTRALDPKHPYGPPLYLVKVDVKMCYASISRDWLMKNIPMDKHVLYEFLNAGYMFQGEFFPDDEDYGIPIGGSISPILANMTLDGIQQAIYNGLYGQDPINDYIDGQMLRYADDMLITVRTYEKANKVVAILEDFLKLRGLKLSAHKTKLIPLQFEGFDFMSRHYRCLLGYVDTAPSEEAIVIMENKMREFISTYRGGPRNLIEALNKKLIGWATYHKVTDATGAFRRIDDTVLALLMGLCKRLHPYTHHEKLMERFFYKLSTGDYTYALTNKPDVRVVRLYDDVKLIRHRPIMLSKNPYLDNDYFDERDKTREIANFTGKYKKIWARQDERCYYCGKPILVDERKDMVPINPGLPETAKNIAYIHHNCSFNQVEFIHHDYDFVDRFDLYRFLEQMIADKSPQMYRKSKYHPLVKFFQQQTKDYITLKFSKIEEIIDRKLCKMAHKSKSFWSQEKISSCWLLNGYRLHEIHFSSHSISFERFEKKVGETLDLPDWLFGRLPKNVCTEIKVYLASVKKRWGL